MKGPIRGLVIHITDGHGDLDVVRADFDSPGKNASTHFCIGKQGEMWQFIDTNDRAWAIDGGTNDSQWISVENVARHGEKLTQAQLTSCALLFEWVHNEYTVPLKRAYNGNDRGLGYHRMFHIGDHVCPGFPVRQQLEFIVRKAGFYSWRDTGDESVPLYMRSYTN
jgi:hypothetical protein